MRTAVFTYDITGSGCRSGWFAYTYKRAATIWLRVPALRSAKPVGTDSMAGTILHEHSHSDADTDDLTYGQANARVLATTKPDYE